MMGEQLGRQDRFFYEFCLEDRVPADHLLRRIDGVLDTPSLEGINRVVSGCIKRPVRDHAKSAFEMGSSEARARHSQEPQGFFPLGSSLVPFCSAAGIPSRIPARLGLLGPAALIFARFKFATPLVRFSHRPGLCQSTTVWGMSVAAASLRALIRIAQI